MKIVLLSGGSGKRLWPLSNGDRSKQFLKVLSNGAGELESMVQRVWGQLEQAGLAENALISTGFSQVEILQNQIGPDVPLIIEPERRDTFPAIAYATTYLHSVQGASPEEAVIFLPVDPYVEESYFRLFPLMAERVESMQANLALMGAKPTFPSAKYGYIMPATAGEVAEGQWLPVDHFVEKPDIDRAAALIERGALWNCGVFAFKIGYMLEFLQREGLPTEFAAMHERYSHMPKTSFDYAVVEKESRISMIPYYGYWKDLGTWNTLTDEMASKQIGESYMSLDSENTHILNELNVPVAVIGVSDIVVAASLDGILVTDKDSSPKVKDLITFDHNPRYEERSWGTVRILDSETYLDGQSVVTKRVHLTRGMNMPYLRYKEFDQAWTVTRGHGTAVIDGTEIACKAGDVLHIPRHACHSVKAELDMEFIQVMTGHASLADAPEELCKEWQDIVRQQV